MTLSTILMSAGGGVVALLVLALLYGAGYAMWADKRWPSEGRMVDTGVGPLHVVEAGAAPGEGPVVVLVHGASANTRELRSVLEAPLVAAGYRVISFDRPGFGGSPGFDGAPRLAGHAAALAALMDALDLEQPLIVGHSYGGAVALRHAIDFPGRVTGYVLLGPVTHGDVGPAAWYNHVGAVPVLGWLFSRAVIPIAGPASAADGLIGTFAPSPAPDGHADATGVGLLFRPATFRANARDLAHINPELLEQQQRYDEITAPLAIIAGDSDGTVRTTRHSDRLAVTAPDTRLAILPGVGHMPHHAAPDLVLEHIAALLPALGAGAAQGATQ